MRVFTAAIVMVFSLAVMAQGNGNGNGNGNVNGGQSQLVLTAAEFDFDGGTALISGLNLGETFPFDGTLKLFLPGQGEVILTVLDFDPSSGEILAELPLGIEDLPGTYLLSASRGTAAINNDSFAVTIGAVGADGAQGETGAQGLQGVQGLAVDRRGRVLVGIEQFDPPPGLDQRLLDQ